MANDNTALVIMALVATMALVVSVPYFVNKQRVERKITVPDTTTQDAPLVRFSGGAQNTVRPKRTTPEPVRRSTRIQEPRKSRSVAHIEPTSTNNPAMVGPVASATRNSPVEVVLNSGGGDCLFLCFEEAIAECGVSVSVQELRAIVAESMTEDKFVILKAIYDGAVEEKEYEVIKDYNFMRGVTDVGGLKQAMMTTHYWGDEMALSAIEDASGVCAVVVTPDDKGRPVVAKKLGESNAPDTNRFILLLLEHSHYQLVRYNGHAILDKNKIKKAVNEVTRSANKK